MMVSTNTYRNLAVSKPILFCLLLCLCVFTSFAQQTQKVNKEFARGDFINDVQIIISENEEQTTASDKDMEDFYNAFFIKPGAAFNPLIADLAMNRIKAEANVQNAYYELFEAETGSGTLNRPLSVIVYVTLKSETKQEATEKGIVTKNGFKDFPVIYESGQSQFKFFLNGGAGLYNDVNALFSKGAEFTQGNPIADDPAGRDTRFWGEAFLEPGISGISKLGNSNIYAYGEASVLASARNTSDIYASGSTAYIAFERLYGGFLAAGLGKQKNITINANYGRNFFQLNITSG